MKVCSLIRYRDIGFFAYHFAYRITVDFRDHNIQQNKGEVLLPKFCYSFQTITCNLYLVSGIRQQFRKNRLDGGFILNN